MPDECIITPPSHEHDCTTAQSHTKPQVSRFASQGHLTFDLEIPLGLHVDATQQLLERVGGAESLLQGAKQAYICLAKSFAQPDSTIPENSLCPSLQGIFSGVSEHYAACKIRPKVHLEENQLQSELLGIWLENGKGEMEFLEKIAEFFNPLIFSSSPSAEQQGRRVVAAVKFTSVEMFELDISPEYRDDVWLNEISEMDKSVRSHYYVFESVLDHTDEEDLDWRVRCINMATRPAEGTKIVYER